MNNENLPDRERQFARLRVYRGTCYGSPALTIGINFESGEKIACEFSEGFKKKTILIERAEVENFLLNIFGIIEKEEILTGLHHVDVRYHAGIEWENLAFIEGEKSGNFKAFSDEWFVEEIECFMLDEDAGEEFVERMQKIPDKKPHRHALEIYSAVQEFRSKKVGYDLK